MGGGGERERAGEGERARGSQRKRAIESKGDEKALLKQIEVRRDEEARKIEEESRKEATLALQIKQLTQAQQSLATETKLRVKVCHILARARSNSRQEK